MKMSKKISLLLSLTALLVCFGCTVVNADVFDFGATEEVTTTVDDVTFYADGKTNATALKETVGSYVSVIQGLDGFSAEELQWLDKYYASQTDFYGKYLEVYGENGFGTYVSYDNVAITETENADELVLTADIHFTEADVNLKLEVKVYSNIGIQVQDTVFEVYNSSASAGGATEKATTEKVETEEATTEENASETVTTEVEGKDDSKTSLADRMMNALSNTLLGMGTVFVVLILISLIISCFAFIPKIQAAFSKKEGSKEPVITESIINEPVAVKSESVDDTELIAVIAAAIAASENTTTDGFVVRSIRKRVSR